MSILVQVERRVLLRLSLEKGHRYRTALTTQDIAPPVAGLYYIFQRMSHHIVPHMSGEMLRAPIPKADSPFPIYDVDPYRQVLH
jgi:hypothetical protein